MPRTQNKRPHHVGRQSTHHWTGTDYLLPGGACLLMDRIGAYWKERGFPRLELRMEHSEGPGKDAKRAIVGIRSNMVNGFPPKSAKIDWDKFLTGKPALPPTEPERTHG